MRRWILAALSLLLPVAAAAQPVDAAGRPIMACFQNGTWTVATSGTVTVGDGSGPLTVDGTLTCNLAAGTNNIGDVDVLTLPSVTIGTFPDNEPFNVAQINGVTPLMGNGATGTGSLRVTVADNNTPFHVIHDSGSTTAVTQATASNLNAEVQGDAANDASVSGNPVLTGGRSSAAAPTDVGADGRAVSAWYLRNGAQASVVTAAGALIGGDAANGLDVDVTRLPANASTNLAQVGGTNVSTGTGAGGAGIPRVTISNDSSLAANQSVNMAQVGGTNTVTGGVAGSQGVGGLAADGAAATGNPVRIGGKDGSGNNQDLLTDTSGNLSTSFVWPNGPPGWIAIDATDSLRCKVWNAAGCQINGTQTATCEDYQGGLSIDFMRVDANGRPVGTKVRSTKVLTYNNDMAAQGAASGGASWPFGASASRESSIATADSPGTSCAITIITTGELVTSCSHGFTVGAKITINITGNGANTTPSVDGLHQVLIQSSTTYSLLDVDITSGCDDGGGTVCPGSHYGSRNLTTGSAFFTSGMVGKTATVSTGGVVCTSADIPCQNGKFPEGTLWQGTIISFVSSTSVGVFPTLHVDPGGGATVKVEPILLGDSDGAELGRGWWLPTSSLHYWSSEAASITGTRAGIQEGQTFYECEINRNPQSAAPTFAMHDGGKLASDYQETSYHIPLNGTVSRHKGDTNGWARQQVVANPSAGVDLSSTVPTNAVWDLSSVRLTVAASSTQQTRIVALLFDDGGSNVDYAPVPQAVQMASTTITYTWCRACQNTTVILPLGNIQMTMPLPYDIRLTEGARVRTAITGIHASDQISGAVFKYRQRIAE